MLADLPALAHLFGLHPWDVDRLQYDEARLFLTYRDKATPEGGE